MKSLIRFLITPHTLATACSYGVLFCCICCVSYANASDKWLDEAQASWKVAKESADKFQGRIEVRDSSNGLAEIPSTIVDFKQNLPWRLVHLKYTSQRKATELVTGLNSAYAFQLKRTADTAPWVQIDGAPASSADNVIKDANESMTFGKYMLFQCPYVAVWDLVSQDTFVVTEASQANRDGINLFKVSFTNTHEVTAAPFCPVQAGTIFFDRENGWCIKEAEFATKYANGEKRETVATEYQLVEGAVIPKRYYQVREGGPTPRSTVEYLAYVQVADVLPPESEFKLAAFGIGEPKEFESGSHGWIWLALAGLIAVLCAFVMTRVLRSKRA